MITDKIRWKRIGNTMHVNFTAYATSATGATGGSGTYLFLVPGSQAVNTTDLTPYATASPSANVAQQAASTMKGNGWFVAASHGAMIPMLWDSTHFCFATTNNTSVETLSSGGDTSYSSGSSWGVGGEVELPISGWQP